MVFDSRGVVRSRYKARQDIYCSKSGGDESASSHYLQNGVSAGLPEGYAIRSHRWLQHIYAIGDVSRPLFPLADPRVSPELIERVTVLSGGAIARRAESGRVCSRLAGFFTARFFSTPAPKGNLLAGKQDYRRIVISPPVLYPSSYGTGFLSPFSISPVGESHERPST
jgi:hypothetical protein